TANRVEQQTCRAVGPWIKDCNHHRFVLHACLDGGFASVQSLLECDTDVVLLGKTCAKKISL
ncbi:MAG TPA: hypothetical protein VLW85_02700, partial [Myxococcales bacterium]|nr:hypothetical protein [Myxococcales bacterium]